MFMKIPQKWKLVTIVMVLLGVFLMTEKRAERLGDRYQFALPLLGFGCAIANGAVVDYALRFVVLEGLIHGPKNALKDRPINMRPNGSNRGFPSGHTAAAVFGASYLVHSCIETNLWVKGATLLTAGFVGASRIESENHNIWQVLAGALVGWLTDRLFRRRAGPWAWRKLKKGAK